jgi:type II secretory pathway pseudopilin PulG
MMSIKNKKIKAFSLIELSVILTIIAIIISSLLTIILAEEELERTTRTYEKMEITYDKIKLFIAQQGRLPCPSDPALLTDDTEYGAENCEDIFMCDDNNCNSVIIYQGSIPVETLGLEDDFIYDEFGYKFSYIVAIRDTIYGNNIFSSWGINNNNNEIELTNINNGFAKPSSLLIISHGENGNGAFYKNKIQILETENEEEISNSSHDGVVTIKPDNDFYYGAKTENFDDIVFFKSKEELIDLVKNPIEITIP